MNADAPSRLSPLSPIAVIGADRLKPAGPPHMLFEGYFLQAGASWDRAPDGRFLLLRGYKAARLTHFNVITNVPRFLAQKLSQTK